jgi:hypothetical protein
MELSTMTRFGKATAVSFLFSVWAYGSVVDVPDGGPGGSGGVSSSSSSSSASSSSSSGTTTTTGQGGSAGAGGGATGGGTGTAGSGGTTGGGGSGGAGGATGGGGSGGAGGATCGAELKRCGESCVPLDDPAHGCSAETCAPCETPQALPRCLGGACAVDTCVPGFLDCDQSPADGCETIAGTVQDCASCGDACAFPHAGAACSPLLVCTFTACDAGFADCNGTLADGCEIALEVDPSPCGLCLVDAHCTPPATCGGGNPGTPGLCGCTKQSCATLGATCGAIPDGCGGTLSCNGVKDGGETDVDCGGPSCADKCAPGQACAAATDCASGFCTDGVCCDSACNGLCKSCALPGSVGSCSNTPFGSPEAACVLTGTCNGHGACTLGIGGYACTQGYQCASSFCVDGYCCNTACTGTCRSCAADPLSFGSCLSISVMWGPSVGDPNGDPPCSLCNYAGSCVKHAAGSPCTFAADCASFACVGGICQ